MARMKEKHYASVDSVEVSNYDKDELEIHGHSLREDEREVRILVTDPDTAVKLATDLLNFAGHIYAARLGR